MRSYEIGAIGACGLYEDTKEHRKLLPNYPEEGFFSSPSELRDQVKSLLRKQKMRERMRKQATQAICNNNNTYYARLKEIIEYSGECKER